MQMSRSGVFRTACAVAFAVLPGAGCDDTTGPGADSRPPTLQLQSPAAGAALAGDSVVVAGSASDDEGVARIAYSLNGGEEKTVEGGATPFGFVVRGTALGTNRLVVRAYDAAGNRGEASVEFTVSDAAPPRWRWSRRRPAS
ncbi:MAG TPA: Ig-like domain-containing protein [Longimicrobiaceae bacterium]|nr:Ig-like domain-containing protein [Longimicrobiaceae bacterium]